jgi:hypothetical protein
MTDNPPMMICGHVANSTGKRPEDTEARPACVICSCFDVTTSPPDLAGRRARCYYFGKIIPKSRYNANCCWEGCVTGEPCKCEQPSSRLLWFFEYKPDQEYDTFYCACMGAT